MEKNRENIVKKVRLSTVVESLLALSFVALVTIAVIAYYFSPANDSFAGKFLKNISYPIVAVDGNNFIYTSQIKDSLGVLKKYYQSEDIQKTGSRVDFSTEDGKKRLKIKEKEILNKEIENESIEILAKKRGISLSNDEIRDVLGQKISVEGFLGKDLNDFVTTYGWTTDKIKNKIIIPLLYAKKLKESVSGELEGANMTARESLDAAKKELEDDVDFAEVAKKYSQGSSAEKGGSLGWITRQQMLPEVAEKVFSSDFQLSGGFEIIESVLGYHIVKIEEIKKEEGMDSVRMSQIFVRKNTFYGWLDGQMKKMNIKMLTKEYYWDKDNASVDFADESMREFEKSERENPKGDASVSTGTSQNVIN